MTVAKYQENHWKHIVEKGIDISNVASQPTLEITTTEQRSRLRRIDMLLNTGDHAALQTLTRLEMPRRLLSEECLDEARAMKLPVTVIYLSTLALNNLSQSTPFDQWLAVYQSLNKGAESDGLKVLRSRHPLRVVTQHLLSGNLVAESKLRQCKGDAVAWCQALELAFDHARFDFVLRILRTLVKKKLDILDWLHISKSMTRRKQGPKKDQADVRLGQSYLLIRQQLRSSLSSVDKVRSTLSLCASDCFYRAKEYALTLEAAKLASAPEDRARAAYETARVHCHLDDIPSTLKQLDNMIALMGLDSVDFERQPPKEFVTADAAHALVDLQNALSEVGQKAFLVSGTLLGFAREGKILDHDKDLDLGVIGVENQFDVAQALLQSGRFRIDMRGLREYNKTYHLKIYHLDARVSIDIFIYHPEGGKLVTGVQSDFGYLQKFAFTPFELKTVSFMGIDFFVPKDMDLKLTENFGEWRHSDPDYISHLQSPSTVDVGGPIFQVVGRLRALEAIRDQKPERLARVIDIMALHQRREGGMSEATISVLRAELARHQAAPVAALPALSHV